MQQSMIVLKVCKSVKSHSLTRSTFSFRIINIHDRTISVIMYTSLEINTYAHMSENFSHFRPLSIVTAFITILSIYQNINTIIH